MSCDDSIWISGTQLFYEGVQGAALLRGASVARLPAAVKSADITHADAVVVVAFAVCPGLLLCPALLYCAVKTYDIMVAALLPASLAVPAVHVVEGERLSLARRCAVDDDVVSRTLKRR